MYWLVYKLNHGNREYISGIDEHGYPTHTTQESKAWKIYNFDLAMSYFNLGVGYCVAKVW